MIHDFQIIYESRQIKGIINKKIGITGVSSGVSKDYHTLNAP